jgi:hypothetical protein
MATEPLATVEPPQLPATGKRIGFQEALGIQQPYMQRKAELLPQISQAEGDVARAQQAQAETLATGKQDAAEQLAGAERSARQGYEQKLEAEPLPAFVPTKDTVQDIAGLFSLIGVIGMVAGKGDAQRALSAMNGMLEGHQKGRKDLYQQERIEFEKNFNAMVKKHEEFRKEMEDAVKTAQTDYQAGLEKANVAAAKAGSEIVKAQVRKGDLMNAYKLVEDSEKGVNHALDMEAKARSEEARAREARIAAQERFELQKQLAEIRAQGGSRATQQQFIAQRSVNALREAASTMESVMKLPAGTTAGFLPYLSSKEGMTNYIKSAGGRKMSSADQKAVETLYSGLSRNLATIEASGTATGLTGLSEQIKTLYPKAGDTIYDVALKVADIRRITTEGVGAMIESGLLPAQQAKAAQEQIQRMEKAIPFTTNDVIEARFGGQRSIGEASAEAAKQMPSFNTPEEADAAGLPKGTKILVNGRRATVE